MPAPAGERGRGRTRQLSSSSTVWTRGTTKTRRHMRARSGTRTRLREERVEAVVLDGGALGLLAVCGREEKDVSVSENGGEGRAGEGAWWCESSARARPATRARRVRGHAPLALHPSVVARRGGAAPPRSVPLQREDIYSPGWMPCSAKGGGGGEKTARRQRRGTSKSVTRAWLRRARSPLSLHTRRAHSPRQNSSQQALPVCTPAWPRWMRMISRICEGEGRERRSGRGALGLTCPVRPGPLHARAATHFDGREEGGEGGG